MDEPNAQLDWFWSCTALCRMKAWIIAGADFSAAQRLQHWMQVPVGKRQEGLGTLAEVWGFCSSCYLMVPASRCSCPALCVLAGWAERIWFWHGGATKGKDRLYKV